MDSKRQYQRNGVRHMLSLLTTTRKQYMGMAYKIDSDDVV